MVEKILNICVNGIYTDGYTYHENLLPKYHKKLGYDVYILASEYEFGRNGKPQKADKMNYVDKNGIKIQRLSIVRGKTIEYKFKRFKGFYQALEKIAPDIIFCHLFQFLDVILLVKYKRKHKNVRIFMDSHADYINSARTFLSKYILHRIIWKYCAHKVLPITEKFYGVLPARVKFLEEVYEIPDSKVELLVMGVDDEIADRVNTYDAIRETRLKYGIGKDEFLIATGGKINQKKRQVLLLIEAMRDINAKLIVFGPVAQSIRQEFDNLCGENIVYAGWLSTEESYSLFAASNLVVFPSTHSVYWEQVAGQGIPMVLRHWDGIEHIDLGGNIKYLYSDSVEEIKNAIVSVMQADNYSHMLEIAQRKGREKFSYLKLAEKSII